MDCLFEICESTTDRIPDSLSLVVSSISERQDRTQLFLSVIYVLALEGGFEPQEDDDAKGHKQSKDDLSGHTGQQMAFKYDSAKVLRWSKEKPANFFTKQNFLKWRFSIGGLGTLTLGIEFVRSANRTLALTTGVVPNSKFSVNNCFEVSKFVPCPETEDTPLKFANLSHISQEFKSSLWLAKIEILSVHGLVHNSAFEFLPEHVLRLVASFLPKRKTIFGLRI